MIKLKKCDNFINESGIPHRQILELQSKIREYVSTIEPNQFYTNVSGEASKFGKMISVCLNGYLNPFELPVKITTLNEEIKHISFVYNLIDIISESEGVDSSNVILTSYDFFGRKHKGQKNGHTGEVEDVISRLEDDMNHCRSIEASSGYGYNPTFFYH